MSDADVLARLSTAMWKLLDRQRMLHRALTLVETLERNGPEQVRGERGFFDDLSRRLEAICAQVRDAPPATVLAPLEALVGDDDWELAATLAPQLEARLADQRATIRKAQSQLKAWEVEFNELANTINGARLAGAPFALLEDELKAVARRIAQLRSSLTDRLYGELQDQCDAGDKAISALAGKVKEARALLGRVKGLVQQADLLIMNTGYDGDGYHYRVLLRCADRTQTRGISIIQEIKRLTPKDRDEFLLGGFKKLSEDIALPLRAQHVTAGQPAAAVPGPPPDVAAALRELGRVMGGMMLSPQMRDVLWQSDWSFSITTNDLQLPWELMVLDPPPGSEDDERVLCLSKSISRMPLGDSFPRPRRGARRIGARRRMLLIHSDPEGTLPWATHEVDNIAGQLDGLLDIVRLDPHDATNTRLNHALSGDAVFDFLHFTGHAHFDAEDPGRSGLQLRDSLLDVGKIRSLSRGGSLVFLNACESASIASTGAAQARYPVSRADPFVGLASAFIYSGALGCIGSLWPIYDRAASELAVRFYRFVLGGDPTGEALRRARAEIQQAYPVGTTWAGYVLYGDPTFRLTES